jgi:hypothetical protein
MPPPLKRLTTTTLCLLALLLADAAPAQEERWYRVELLVFSQQAQGAGSGEQWVAIPELAYPEPLRFLIEPGRIAANLRAYRGRSSIDGYGRQIIDVRSPAGGEPDTGGDAAGSAFTLLPASELEFRDKAVQMSRSGRYRTLFHEAWQQPVGDKAAAVPIALDHSGDGGHWPALQGSINLYLSRYIHLQTNLWLNTNGEYFPGAWRMPPPPLAPPSLIVTGLPAQAEQPYWVTHEAESAAPGAVYPYRHAVLLRQSRRMRSNEIHYIDHPLMGLLVKLTPLGPQARQAADPEGPEDAEAQENAEDADGTAPETGESATHAP